MPKLKKLRSSKVNRKTPLYVDLMNDRSPHKNVKLSRDIEIHSREDDDDYNDTTVVEASTSAKILRMAEEQQLENDDEDISTGLQEGESDPVADCHGYIDIETDFNKDELDQVFHKSDPNAGEQRTLVDLILAKIQEKEKKKEAGQNSTLEEEGPSPKVIEVYTEIGKFLAKYKSGKLPKALKIVPLLSNWEEILCLADPLHWTPNAMHETTRVFASNFTPRMAQRFYNLVLLPAVKDDIQTNKKLNYHYYQALKRAMFKPAAWFKGILFPLLSESCSLREAVIIGSVLSKVSVPVVHVAASLIRIFNLHRGDTQQWSPPISYIICIMLNKKCALPTSAVAAAVIHFKSFLSDTRQLPVVWHRAFLCLVQRYKFGFSPQHRTDIYAVLKAHFHKSIGPEIRSELQQAESMKWTLDADTPML